MTSRETSSQDKLIDGMRYTPENVRELKEGQVFVFGSDLGGAHGGGAAAAAVRYFGAIWGQVVLPKSFCDIIK